MSSGMFNVQDSNTDGTTVPHEPSKCLSIFLENDFEQGKMAI